MSVLRHCVIALLIAILALPAVSQSTAAPVAATAAEKAQWLERANLVTDVIQEEAKNLPSNLQVILPARLGEIWRKVDPKRAQGWIAESLTRLTTQPETESTPDRKARLQSGYSLLEGLNRADPVSADRLLDSMVGELQRSASSSDGLDNQEVIHLGAFLENAIMNSARDNPDRAFALAERILQLRAGNEIIPAYLNLKSADPERADQFARKALQAARSDYDSLLLFGLAQLANPSSGIPEKLRAPEQLGSEILKVLAAGMLRPPQGPADKENICRLAAPVTMAMQKFPPAQQAQLRVAVENCKAGNAQIDEEVRHMVISAQDGPAGELLTQAADAKDAHARAELKMKAAGEAERAKDYQGALDILLNMSPEEREATAIWNSRWTMNAFLAIRSLYRAHDLQAIQQIIARAPDAERAALMLDVCMVAYGAKDQGYGLVLLTQARRELEKNPVTGQYMPYLQLMDAYAAHVPEEAASVLRLVVEGLNNFKVPEDAKVRPVEPGRGLEPITIPGPLLDSDPQMVSAAIAEITSPQARVAMRLGLLQACLRRYQGPPPAPKPTQAPARGANSPARPAGSTVPAPSSTAPTKTSPPQPH